MVAFVYVTFTKSFLQDLRAGGGSVVLDNDFMGSKFVHQVCASVGRLHLSLKPTSLQFSIEYVFHPWNLEVHSKTWIMKACVCWNLEKKSSKDEDAYAEVHCKLLYLLIFTYFLNYSNLGSYLV